MNEEIYEQYTKDEEFKAYVKAYSARQQASCDAR